MILITFSLGPGRESSTRWVIHGSPPASSVEPLCKFKIVDYLVLLSLLDPSTSLLPLNLNSELSTLTSTPSVSSRTRFLLAPVSVFALSPTQIVNLLFVLTLFLSTILSMYSWTITFNKLNFVFFNAKQSSAYSGYLPFRMLIVKALHSGSGITSCITQYYELTWAKQISDILPEHRTPCIVSCASFGSVWSCFDLRSEVWTEQQYLLQDAYKWGIYNAYKMKNHAENKALV